MRRRLHGTTGIAIAFILGVALATGTTASAAMLITSKQIKNGTIKMKDLSPKVRAKIEAPGVAGPQGAPGATGVAGPTGPAGPPGKFSGDNVQVVTGNAATYPIPFPGGIVPQSNATCPAGTVAIGGWYEMQGVYYAEPSPFISSYRQPDPRVWSVVLQWSDSYPTGAGNPTYVAKAMCAG
jgi:hypothetical protein